METEVAKDRVCEEMAIEIIKSMEAFLQSFHQMMEANARALSPTLLTNFLTAADRLNNECSQKVAWTLLAHSEQPDVRASSEGTLIRLVRNRCLETLDVILENYVGYVAQLQTDLRQTVRALSDSRLRNALMGTEGLSSDKVKRFKLPTAAKESAILKMFEFFNNLRCATDLLMDYACDKLVAGAADQEQVNRLTAMVQTSLEAPLHNVLSLLENHEIIKRKRWEEQSAAENATLSAVAAASSFKMDQRKSSWGAFLLSVLFALPVCYLWSWGAGNLYVGVATAVSAILALVCFVRGMNAVVKDY